MDGLIMMFFRRSLLALGAVAVIATAAACGGDDDATPTTAPAGGATTASSPVASTVASAYPVKVTDMAKKSVEIKAKPTKIVGVSPTAVEVVYAAGGTVVGRSSSVKFPAAAQQAADIGSAYAPSAEKILALKPDLVVGDAAIIKGQPDIAKALDGLGVPVLYVGAESYADVLAGLDLMGKVLDSTKTTDQVKAQIEKSKEDAKAALAGAGANITVMALTADEKSQLYAAKDNSYVGDILKQLGIKNPGSTLPDTPPLPGYSLVAPEKMLELNPDYIIAITPDPRAPQLSGILKQIPPFRGLKAISGNKVIDGDTELFLQAPGPRVGDAFKVIADAFKAGAR
jgi:iron complex transport system substrate-binding protein